MIMALPLTFLKIDISVRNVARQASFLYIQLLLKYIMDLGSLQGLRTKIIHSTYLSQEGPTFILPKTKIRISPKLQKVAFQLFAGLSFKLKVSNLLSI